MKLNILILFILGAFIGCQKDVDEFQPYVQTAVDFPEILKPQPIYRQFDAGIDSEIDLGAGEVLFFPAHSMVNNRGELLTGKIDLEITKIAKKADLIFSYLNSNIASTQLNNYHIINIKAFANKQHALIKPGHFVTLKSPMDNAVTAGSVWTGVVAPPNIFEWNAVGINNISATNWDVGGTDYSGISYKTKKLGWISSGQSSSGAVHSLCVNLGDGLKPAHTKVYFIFDDQFSVAELKEFSDTKQFCTDIPNNTKGHLIIINEEEKGNFRFQDKAITISGDLTIQAQPRKTVLENIVTTLNSL